MNIVNMNNDNRNYFMLINTWRYNINMTKLSCIIFLFWIGKNSKCRKIGMSTIPSINQYSLGVDKCLLLLALNETQLWHMDKHNNNIISGTLSAFVCLFYIKSLFDNQKSKQSFVQGCHHFVWLIKLSLILCVHLSRLSNFIFVKWIWH